MASSLSRQIQAGGQRGMESKMNNHAELEALFAEHGYTDFKWIKPEDIVVSQWVRMKCTFGVETMEVMPHVPPMSLQYRSAGNSSMNTARR